MTTLYRPVLIESAEQAEALPEGTIMFLPAGPYVWTARDPGGEFLDHYGRPWHFENTQDDEPFTALVPIEAEEEQVAVAKASDGTETCYNPDAASHPVFGGYIGSLPIRTRLVTPWEAV